MKIKHYIYDLGILLLLTIVGSCSMHIDPTGDDHNGDLKMKNLYLNIQRDNVLKSKAKQKGLKNGNTDDNIASGTITKFSNGILVAVDGNGFITTRYDLVVDNPKKGQWLINDLLDNTKGIPVPSESKFIYIWGNLMKRGSDQPKTGIDLSKFQKMMKFPTEGDMPSIAVPEESMAENDSQKKDEETTASDAIIYGESEIKQTGNKFVANTALIPMISRIEISQIQGTDLSAFNVNGIYMDSLIMSEPINGKPTLTSDGRIPNSNLLQSENKGDQSATYFTPGNTNFVYAKDGYDKLANYVDLPNCIGTRNDKIVTPVDGSNKVWAYNIFSGYTYKHSDSGSKPDYDGVTPIMDPAHIVLYITGATKASSSNEAEPGYVVLKTYKEQGGGVVKGFKPGYVYKIPSINFEYNDIWPDPSPHDGINVTVEVSVIPWTPASEEDIDI